MAELFATGRIVDLILGLVCLEAIALALASRYCAHAPVFGLLLANVASGACLLLALRFALVEGPWTWIAACLLGALGMHVTDLRSRWNRRSA